jgi:hypothetical protein
VVQDNLATLYGAVDDGAVTMALPKFVKKELEGYLDCGLLRRGRAYLGSSTRSSTSTRRIEVGYSSRSASIGPKPWPRPWTGTA